METQSTPRITCPYLESYVGKSVIIVGKVTQIRGEMVVIDADGSINLQLNREARVEQGSNVQIVGKVNPDLSVKVLSTLYLDSNVDFNIYKTVVEVTHQYKDIFISA